MPAAVAAPSTPAAVAAPSLAPLRRSVLARLDPVLALAVVGVVVLAAFYVFARPGSDVAAVPPSQRLVVADLRGHALVVLDTGDPASARRIALPGGPHEVVALPDGRLAVSLEQFGTVALVDPVTGEVRALHVGGTPHGLAVGAGMLHVTDRAVNAVRRFSLATWQEETPVASGAWPHIIAARPDGSLAIANAADDSLSLGDRVVPVSHVPESIAVAADGRVATAGSVGGVLHVFDAGGALLEQHQVGGRPVRLLYDPRGETLAAALSADGAVAILEGGVVRRVAVGGVPDGLAFSPDGRWLYVADMFGGTVSIVEVARGRVAQRIAAAQTAGALLVLPPVVR